MEFSVLADTPSSQRLSLRSDGKIVFTDASIGGAAEIGEFTDGVPLHFDINFDLGLQEPLARVVINDQVAYLGAFSANGGDITTLRFSLGLRLFGSPPNHLTNVYLDDIVVTGTTARLVPEPGCSILLLSVAFWVVAKHERRRNAMKREANKAAGE